MKLQQFYWVGLWLAALAAPRAGADDFFKGMRGPTLFQVEDKVTLTHQDNGVDTFVNNFLAKYWDGTNVGKWATVNVPYKVVQAGQGHAEGLGDLILTGGPRFTIPDWRFHGLPYAAVVLPTARQTRPALGNHRTDLKAGLITTWLSEDNRWNVDSQFEHTFAEHLPAQPVVNETYAGAIAGRELNRTFMVGAGEVNTLSDDGKYRADLKALVKINFVPKVWFSEIIYYHTVSRSETPGRDALELQVRVNF